MTSLQQHEGLFELVHDSVMTRTVEGRINFWNHSAEELYGWRKEQAIGKVSHNLLQTQFPKPLKEIESELVRNGVWEGKLVHTTRDGRRVMVESRWTLGTNGHSGSVVEANTRSPDEEMRTKAGAGRITTERKESRHLSEQTAASSQSQEYLLELVHDGVMTRSVDGRINFWNHSAEELYGWRKEEAIGRVSHNLLQTQFPKPLKEIESELIRNGVWEGKLVHTTQDGRRVMVESRWTLDPGDSGVVVEANIPFANSPSSVPVESPIEAADKTHTFVPSTFLKREGLQKIANALLVGGAFLCMIAVTYGIFGHQIIEAIYTSPPNQIIDSIVHRDVTSLTNYFREADRRMADVIIGAFSLGLLLFFLLKEPLGFAIAGFSVFVFSFTVFGVVEMFPSMARLLRLDAVSGYYAYKSNYVYDEGLIFREVPLAKTKIKHFKGSHYSPLFRIEVPPVEVEWVTDRHGFRNNVDINKAEVVVLGDSFMEYGNNEADTFVKRLESKLAGLTIQNLAKSGYGPAQYLEVLRRFGVQLKPKYALLAIYGGNDFEDTETYLQWIKGELPASRDLLYRIHKLNVLERYWTAAMSVLTGVKRAAELSLRIVLENIAQAKGYDYGIHPDLALLDLGNSYHKVLFIDKPFEATAANEIKRILSDIHDICQRNDIVPVILYVPPAAEIYARYSTDQSGTNWLSIRPQEIAAGNVRANTVKQLADEANMPFLSLVPPLEAAAKEGKLVYQNFDSHWNSEGTELAAAYTADMLADRLKIPKLSPQPPKL